MTCILRDSHQSVSHHKCIVVPGELKSKFTILYHKSHKYGIGNAMQMLKSIHYNKIVLGSEHSTV